MLDAKQLHSPRRLPRAYVHYQEDARKESLHLAHVLAYCQLAPPVGLQELILQPVVVEDAV